MNKADLRKQYKALRRAFTPEDLEDQGIAIANHLLKLKIWDKEFFHLFLSIPRHKELDTEPILSMLMGMDKNVVLSRSDFADHSMTHYLLTETTRIKANDYGIPEPVSGIVIKSEQLDVVFVPMLVCDIQGNRLGYGAGFYDRFLSQCRPDCIKIGLSQFKPIESVPSEFTDVALDYCVTAGGVVEF